jgi:hypothetical protein
MTLWELLIFVVVAWVQLVQDKRYDEITTIKWSFGSIVPRKFWFNRTSKIGAVEGVSVGVMKDYKLKLRDLVTKR